MVLACGWFWFSAVPVCTGSSGRFRFQSVLGSEWFRFGRLRLNRFWLASAQCQSTEEGWAGRRSPLEVVKKEHVQMVITLFARSCPRVPPVECSMLCFMSRACVLKDYGTSLPKEALEVWRDVALQISRRKKPNRSKPKNKKQFGYSCAVPLEVSNRRLSAVVLQKNICHEGRSHIRSL